MLRLRQPVSRTAASLCQAGASSWHGHPNQTVHNNLAASSSSSCPSSSALSLPSSSAHRINASPSPFLSVRAFTTSPRPNKSLQSKKKARQRRKDRRSGKTESDEPPSPDEQAPPPQQGSSRQRASPPSPPQPQASPHHHVPPHQQVPQPPPQPRFGPNFGQQAPVQPRPMMSPISPHSSSSRAFPTEPQATHDPSSHAAAFQPAPDDIKPGPMHLLNAEVAHRYRQHDLQLTPEEQQRMPPHLRISKPVSEGRLSPRDVPFKVIPGLRPMKVATLAHGLDRVLFNPGVHVLKDSRTGIYNYEPKLNKIPDVDLFDFSALTPYITSSQDKELETLAIQHSARFRGSTSSLTGILSQIYFLVSGWKRPSYDDYTRSYGSDTPPFGQGARLPASIAVRPTQQPDDSGNVIYSIDADKIAQEGDFEPNYVLAQLGKAMEKFFTSSPEKFKKYLRVNRSHLDPHQVEAEPEAYHYAKAGNSFLMRSQLDCSDERLPGKTFDLKTRAVVAIRGDRANWSEGSGYQITYLDGKWESFERERWDLTRSAFLKFYMQAKIGNMDGIFVAYHNAAQTFGFEYFPIEDLAKRIFGSVELADQAFRLSVGLAEEILNKAVALSPGKEMFLTLNTLGLEWRDGAAHNPDKLLVYVEHPPKDGEEVSQQNQGEDKDQQDQQPQNQQQQQQEAPRQKPDDDTPAVKVRGQLSLLEVSIDRYVNGLYARGAIDFNPRSRRMADERRTRQGRSAAAAQASKSATPESEPESGSGAGAGADDIDATREHNEGPILELDYSISRSKQSQIELQNAFRSLREQQFTLSQLSLPNVEAVNDRERRLAAELSVDPIALQRYRDDKKSGVAAGMPRAPGQVELFLTDDGGVVAGGDVADESAAGAGTGSGKEDATKKQQQESKTPEKVYNWKTPNRRVLMLRALSRQGAASLEKEDKNAVAQLYQRSS